MPAKVKGMTSIEIAVLVAIVLAIAIAVGWYLYTTFGAAVGKEPYIKVVSATAYTWGVIEIVLYNTGSTGAYIWGAEVFGEYIPWDRLRYPDGTHYIGPSGNLRVVIETGRWIRQGSIVQGRLILEGGNYVPFSARVER